MVTFAIGMLGPWELGIILVIVLIFFGVGKLPQVFASLGQGVKAFKDAQKDDALDATPTPKSIPDEAEEVRSQS
jgi:sec-independent protein translocase protein TatA